MVTRYTRSMDPNTQLDALLDGLTVAQVRSVLRHPAWPADQRCDCSQYGIPYDADIIILDNDRAHTAVLCQPRREWVEP